MIAARKLAPVYLLAQVFALTNAATFTVTDANCTAIAWTINLTGSDWSLSDSIRLWMRNVTNSGTFLSAYPVSRFYTLQNPGDINSPGTFSFVSPTPPSITAGTYQIGVFFYDEETATNSPEDETILASLTDDNQWDTPGCSASSTSSSSSTLATSTASASQSLTPPASTSTISSSAAASTQNPADDSSGKSNNVGAIVGGVLGGLVAIAALLLFFLCRRRRRHNKIEKTEVGAPQLDAISSIRGGKKRSTSLEKVDVIQVLATIPSAQGGAWFQLLTQKDGVPSSQVSLPTGAPVQPPKALLSRSPSDEQPRRSVSSVLSKQFNIPRVNVPAYDEKEGHDPVEELSVRRPSNGSVGQGTFYSIDEADRSARTTERQV